MQQVVVDPGTGKVRVRSTRLSRGSGQRWLLAPEFVGICGTDLDIIAGSRADKASVLGHEAVVRVVERPSPVFHGTETGTSYLINPVNAEDQERIIGHSEAGMLQNAVEIPAARAWDGLLVPVLPDLDPLLAVLSEPLGVAIYSAELLAAQALPERLLVVGAGPMGLLTAVTAGLLGVPEVTVVDRSERRLRYAVENGFVEADRVLRRESGPNPDAAALYDGPGPDAIAVCVGREHRRVALRDALRIASPGARIGLTTGFKAGETLCEIAGVDLHQIRRLNVCGEPWPGHVHQVDVADGKCVYLTGHRGTSRRHLLDAMKILINHPELFRRFITDIVSLREVPQSLELLMRERSAPDEAPYRKFVVALGQS
ncbi:zinc-dependent alcohol dehydrogenase [Streptomyces microflavus]|uniref:Zinc-binding dehydrogenase n=1 Tax=Streptomyces microflavus TaxID=1919 RepID=A0A6N9VLA0_STRMI|nr:zinc-binding dehydrogenase [Streptomyces microflavus]NEB71859.1 zinc-binding dehydrogenase [Streptomyces microflavus]